MSIFTTEQALFDLYCVTAPINSDTPPEVSAWWEARIPDYEGAPTSEQLRDDAFERARKTLIVAGFIAN